MLIYLLGLCLKIPFNKIRQLPYLYEYLYIIMGHTMPLYIYIYAPIIYMKHVLYIKIIKHVSYI